jgi:hypothetical protein
MEKRPATPELGPDPAKRQRIKDASEYNFESGGARGLTIKLFFVLTGRLEIFSTITSDEWGAMGGKPAVQMDRDTRGEAMRAYVEEHSPLLALAVQLYEAFEDIRDSIIDSQTLVFYSLPHFSSPVSWAKYAHVLLTLFRPDVQASLVRRLSTLAYFAKRQSWANSFVHRLLKKYARLLPMLLEQPPPAESPAESETEGS